MDALASQAPTAPMIRFIARRLAMAVGILLALSFMVYGVLTAAMDPMEDLRLSTAPNKAQLVAARTRLLSLDEPWYVRYWGWLTQFVQGNPGIAWQTKQRVVDMLPDAVSTSVQLVFGATIIATLLGVTIGVVSALRQYTGFDYSITFVSFVLYSLPIFWVAVLLKEYLAIRLNDFLIEPVILWPALLAFSLVAALFWVGVLGGDRRRKLFILVTSFAVTLGTLYFLLTSQWIHDPLLGIVGLGVLSLAAAYVLTMLFAGIKNKRALYSAVTTVGVGLALYYPLLWVFANYEMTNGYLFVLLLSALAIGGAIGWAFGGPDRMVSVRGAMLVALVMSVLVYADQIMRVWESYSASSAIKNRPIATIGSATPGLNADYWTTYLDKFTHLMLPTIALVLISFAGYTRYERGATLEVLQQDYIRTARAKGLPERVVIVRHALRNALMPLASIIPGDIVALIGGAVLTETIFGWGGMGHMFVSSLRNSEIDPVMTYVMITGALAMIANLIADFLYAILDPRIRVNA